MLFQAIEEKKDKFLKGQLHQNLESWEEREQKTDISEKIKAKKISQMKQKA